MKLERKQRVTPARIAAIAVGSWWKHMEVYQKTDAPPRMGVPMTAIRHLIRSWPRST